MGGFSQVRVPFMTRAVCETAAMYNMVQRKLVADSKSAVVPKTPGIQRRLLQQRSDLKKYMFLRHPL